MLLPGCYPPKAFAPHMEVDPRFWGNSNLPRYRLDKQVEFLWNFLTFVRVPKNNRITETENIQKNKDNYLFFGIEQSSCITLQGINISPDKAYLKMIFLFPQVGYVSFLEGNM